MSIVFTAAESDRFYSASGEHASWARTPPWAVSLWFKHEGYSGGRALFSWGAYSATPSLNVWWYSTKIYTHLEDTDGDYIYRAGSNLADPTGWHLFVGNMAADGTWEIFTDNVSHGTASNASLGTIDVATLLYFGFRTGTGYWFDGRMGEIAFYDETLDATARTNLMTKRPTDCGVSPGIYIPGKDDIAESVAGLTLINDGCVVDSEDHPPVSYGVKPASVFASPVFHSPVVQGA